jgi:hypothetical protein
MRAGLWSRIAAWCCRWLNAFMRSASPHYGVRHHCTVVARSRHQPAPPRHHSAAGARCQAAPPAARPAAAAPYLVVPPLLIHLLQRVSDVLSHQLLDVLLGGWGGREGAGHRCVAVHHSGWCTALSLLRVMEGVMLCCALQLQLHRLRAKQDHMLAIQCTCWAQRCLTCAAGKVVCGAGSVACRTPRAHCA